MVLYKEIATTEPDIFLSVCKKLLTRVAITMHDSLEKQDRVHRNAVFPQLSLDTTRALNLLCLSLVRTDV